MTAAAPSDLPLPETYIVQSADGAPKKLPVTFSAFPDGDTHCVIAGTGQLQAGPALVVHYLYPNQNEQLVRLMLLLDLLRDLGITEVSVFCPYLPYSRQDKRHVAGEALGMHTVCRMLAAAGCVRLYVIDCHFMRGTAEGEYDGLPVTNVPATELLLDACRKQYLDGKPFHTIGPDKGASLLAGGAVGQHMHKTRGDYAAGTHSTREINKLAADHIAITHEAVVVVDDMISTGGTMLRALENLRQKGNASLYCVVTHGLFLNDSFDRLTELADGVIAGDTVPHAAVTPITQGLFEQVVLPDWHRRRKA